MIFLWLAILALTFGLLGFLLHAFYFSKQRLVSELGKEIEDTKRALALHERLNSEAQGEIAKNALMIQSLERRLEQRNQQMSELQVMARRQEDEIRLLQKAASEIRAAMPAEDPEASNTPPPAEPASAITADTGAHKIPLWKDNLNNILSMLDKIEKEVKK